MCKCKRCKETNENAYRRCKKCGMDLAEPSKFSIEQNDKLSISIHDNKFFEKIDEVVKDVFDIRKKDGSKYNKASKCLFKNSKNEIFWFPKLIKDKNWKNELSDYGEIIKQTYIGKNNPKYMARYKKQDEIITNKGKHLVWYIFAKFEEKRYYFIGKFKRINSTKNDEFIYKRESETIPLPDRPYKKEFVYESPDKHKNIIKSIKQSVETHGKKLALG